VQLLEATPHALFLLDELDGYAAGWDSFAFLAGDAVALPF